MEKSNILRLCDLIRETSYAIHCYFKNGYLEKVYENSLANRLRKQGIYVEQQWPLKVYDEDGTQLGDYYADLFVEKLIIIELKTCKALTDEHVAQLLNYLKTSRIRHGLLINFGAPKLQIRKFIV